MPNTPHRERELFERALDLPPSQQAEFLEQTGADPELIARVRELLRLEAGAGRFLGGAAPKPVQPASERSPVTPTPSSNDAGSAQQPAAGQRLGRYRLIEVLGEGGFGVVYLAEQTEPVQRRVALKLLRPELESRRVIARFEAERQLLALMDHPHIARVLDAGATESGRPYFVMELVPGAPLTRYCDDARLSVRDRIELFLDVCGAMQHAHQKGVIHRDLKPSNVLVTQSDDGRALPKVIDFGVAKASQPETGADAAAPESPGAVTRAFELLGTPAYMSPEQARFLGRDVDVRADLYSLGVILHELLVGRTPFAAPGPGVAEFDAWRRKICDDEAPRLTARWRALSAIEQIELAARRQASPGQLGRQLARDLEWIVGRCLEQDRERRYPSVAALAADLRHHLADEPIEAAAPGLPYRLGKFVRRHRLAVAAAAVVAITMAAATAVSLALAWRATRAEQHAGRLLEQEQRQRGELERLGRLARAEAATAQAVARFLNEDLLGFADPSREPEREITLRAVLDRASLQLSSRLTNEPAVTAALHETLGRAYQNLAMLDPAARHYEAARELFVQTRGSNALETLRVAIEAAFMRRRSGDPTQALAAVESVAAVTRAELGRSHPLSIHAGHRLAWSYFSQSRQADWHAEAEATYQDLQGVPGADDADRLGVMYLVARKRGTVRGGVFEAGEQILLQAMEQMQGRRGPDHPLTDRARFFLAVYYYDHWRNVERSEALFLESLEWRRRTLGERHENTLLAQRNLGLLYRRGQRYAEAQRMYLRVLGVEPGDAPALDALPRLVEVAPLPNLPELVSSFAALTWRGTSREPAAGWAGLAFDDRDDPTWRSIAEQPGNGTNSVQWWRAEFELNGLPAESPVIQVRGVLSGELYLNGVPVGPAFSDPYRTDWWLVASRDATRALRPGRNVLALRLLELAHATRPWRLSLHATPSPVLQNEK